MFHRGNRTYTKLHGHTGLFNLRSLEALSTREARNTLLGYTHDCIRKSRHDLVAIAVVYDPRPTIFRLTSRQKAELEENQMTA